MVSFISELRETGGRAYLEIEELEMSYFGGLLGLGVYWKFRGDTEQAVEYMS